MDIISNILINWYEANKRILPWRDITDPYLIWISEIILQQTRVNQGLDYYNRFIKRFPTIETLHAASEDEVLKYWQGLGYYSRARNLHKAAKQIVEQYSGKFPANYAEVIKLPGIGEYTASAICSFAYNQPYAVIDGNVFRLLSRLFGIETPIDSSIGKKEFSSIANQLMPTANPGTHNQAIMEFGALQCVPVSPDCANCPLSNKCKALKDFNINQLPVKSQKTSVSNRYFNYLHIKLGNATFLQKRTAKDIWQNLYEFPLIESDYLLNSEELYTQKKFKKLFDGSGEVILKTTSNPMKHILSHRVIYAQFIEVQISAPNSQLQQFILVSEDEMEKYAISRLTEIYLEKYFGK